MQAQELTSNLDLASEAAFAGEARRHREDLMRSAGEVSRQFVIVR